MNTHRTLDPSTTTTLHVDREPIALSLPPGSAIFAIRGEAWITQARTAADIVLAAGERFDVPNREMLVISGTHGAADLHVVRPETALAHHGRNVYEFVRSHAAALRYEETGRAFASAGRAVRALVLRVRAAAGFRPRVAHH